MKKTALLFERTMDMERTGDEEISEDREEKDGIL
jgi:hypothetical protein